MSAILQEISEKLQKGKMKEVAELVKQAVADGIAPLTILNEGLMPGMDIIGERFKKNDIFIPEVLIAARAMAAGTDVLRPLLVGEQMEEKGTVVIGTIKDDLHDIGKNLVRMMMESKGLNVIDLGNSVPPAKYVDAAIKHNADIIACSALLTTTMVHIKDVVKGVAESPLAGKVKIMIGGAPVTKPSGNPSGPTTIPPMPPPPPKRPSKSAPRPAPSAPQPTGRRPAPSSPNLRKRPCISSPAKSSAPNWNVCSTPGTARAT